ncbi:hypothetical protein SEA_AMYEV_55 [Arthrobacter phage Amyev]|uniref:Uncharacterized protein n=1 Tax=Arthrobacter phage Amyev TaxID=2832315 RepID=A0AA49B4G2_9CAUD|nr:hypothetical protein PQD88_gp55 [Arthrobacter phage Amyev]UIW13470.1 hypothetical protein SEA_AMYEV_55 [Arthrobacter phage Amyev]
MTMFTFTDADGDSLLVDEIRHGDGVWLRNPGDSAVHITREEAPAVALAILDAAGYVPRFPGNGQIAEGKLYAAAALLQEGVLEEAEAPEIEREALALLNAAADSRYADFPNDHVREFWLRTARKAREIHS